MELGRERDLEQDVLHDIASVGALELEWLPFEKDVVKAPGFGGKHRRITHFPCFGDQCQADSPAGCVAGRPAFAATGIGRMTIGTQALSVDPGQRQRINDFVPVQTEHLCHHGSRCHFHQYDMVEPHLVERILQRNTTLDFMRFDHGGQDIVHGQRCLACRDGST